MKEKVCAELQMTYQNRGMKRQLQAPGELTVKMYDKRLLHVPEDMYYKLSLQVSENFMAGIHIKPQIHLVPQLIVAALFIISCSKLTVIE